MRFYDNFTLPVRFFALLVLLLALSFSPAAAQEFAGVTVNIVTTKTIIAEPLKRRAPDFEKFTGAKINVVEVDFSTLYDTIKSDFAADAHQYDAAVFISGWIPDFAEAGSIEDLTNRVEADAALEWDDVMPFFRNINSRFNGRVYGMPLDGDFFMVYYRTDLLEKAGLQPPATWEDYLTLAKTFNGQDLNGDNEPDYGSCFSKKAQYISTYYFYGIATALLQTQGTDQGAFFDTNDMRPLVNNEAFGAALDMYRDTMTYGPSNEMELDLIQFRNLFLEGRCALTIDWGDIGSLSTEPTAKVGDKIGAVMQPGSRKVLDRASGKLVDCTPELCPYAENGVNYAPYAAVGGWVGAINAKAADNVKAATYAFLSYMSQPAQANVDVTLGITGFNPYRRSQFRETTPWINAGMNEKLVTLYLDAIGKSLKNPNMVLDLRIPQTQQYLGKVLDNVLQSFLKGELSREAAMTTLETEWNTITEQAGKEKQLEMYLKTLSRRR